MKVLSWLIGLPLAVILMLFALSNRQELTIGLWPFEDSLALPVYLAVLAPFIVGLLIGLLGGRLASLKYRSAARAMAREAARLERQLGEQRGTSGEPPKGRP